MIYLHVKDGVAFVWNAEDWLDLRKNHRIVGQLIGCTASLPKQENFMGLPMALLPEETSLLVQQGIATTVQYPSLEKKLSEDMKKQYEAYLEKLTKEQVDAAKEKRKQEIIKNIHRIVKGKRRKLMGLGKQPRKKRKSYDSSVFEEADEIRQLEETDKISQEEETDETSQAEETDEISQEEETDEISQEEETNEISQEEVTDEISQEKETDEISQEEETDEISQEEETDAISQEEVTDEIGQEEETCQISKEEETDEICQEEETNEISQEEVTDEINQEKETDEICQEEETNEISQEEETDAISQEAMTDEIGQEEETCQISKEEETDEISQEEETDATSQEEVTDEIGQEEETSQISKEEETDEMINQEENSLQLEYRAEVNPGEDSTAYKNKSGKEEKISCLERVYDSGGRTNILGFDKVGEEVDISGLERGDEVNGGEVNTTGLEKTGNLCRDKITEMEGIVEIIEIVDSDAASVLDNPEYDAGKISKEIVMKEEFAKIRPLGPGDTMVQTFIECPWMKKDEMEIVRWRIPKTYLKKLKYWTFKFFWSTGHYVTSGAKFGVDFLVYPGDPVMFHSHYMVKCLDYNTTISATQLVIYGRLAHSVGKTFVFAKFDEKRNLDFVSLNWAKME